MTNLAEFEAKGLDTVNLWPEAAGVLGCSKNSAYRAAHAGEIPTIRIGRRIRVPVAALRALLEQRAS